MRAITSLILCFLHQSCLKDDFPQAPFIKINGGETEGLLGFTRTLTDDDIENIKAKLPKIGGGDVSYSRLPGKLLVVVPKAHDMNIFLQ